MDTLDKSEQPVDSNNDDTPTMPDENQNDFLSSSSQSTIKPISEKSYKVLARKYRPQNFDDLMGQDVMVQTLKNAFKIDRIAHAYMLTGVRGIGKTTTARLLARALNYKTDLIDKPNIEMSETGYHCLEIMESRHIDVIEMDAASRTGIADIREIIDSINYSPSSARFKIYIIDEIHMLSKAAFNGLLKTLEEPPSHIKFIFATTEVQKVPLTILSRCQRFDLRRFDNDLVRSLLLKVCSKENVKIDDSVIGLISRASGGSARDSLSLLDQAIALSENDEALSEDLIRKMLGLSDQGRIIDLFEYISSGEVEAALGEIRDQVDIGVDPSNLIEVLGDLVHEMTRHKVTQENEDNLSLGPENIVRLKNIIENESVKSLSRYWQMILKAANEIKNFSKPLSALEMAVIRMCYISDLPTPDEIIKKIESKDISPAEKKTLKSNSKPSVSMISGSSEKKELDQSLIEEVLTKIIPKDFHEIIQLARIHKDVKMQYELENNVSLVSFEKEKIEINILKGSESIASDLSKKLFEWTEKKWIVLVSSSQGEKTINQEREESDLLIRSNIEKHPIYKATVEEFKNTSIKLIEEIPKLSIVENENPKEE
ncbi:MAG: DNA polymerase III subunit gamma/tau [Hyphomicrobiales bacterium]|nr:DNA polymerase III subunit gamma/tau [Hyphomicrobiales bacterium]